MTTTTKLGDYLGRALHNDNPGTSNAQDFLGRNVIASNKDFAGRSLTDTPTYPPPDWQASHAYSLGTLAKIPGTKEVQAITLTSSPTPSFKIGVDRNDGQGVKTTTAITIAGLTAGAIQTALVALSNVEPGDVTVAGSGPYTLTWQEELGNIPQVTIDSTGITGGTVAASTTTQGAVLGAILKCTVAGTSNSTKPTAPAVGATVADNTVTWLRLK